MTGLLHPEHVAGRRLWMDSAMTDLIHKLHHGDPVRGWEGDEALAVYWNPDHQVWEIMRLEDDNQYRLVLRSRPGVPFDERVIDKLCEWDTRRHQRDLHREISDHNERVDAEKRAGFSEYIREEAAPRLHHALVKDGVL